MTYQSKIFLFTDDLAGIYLWHWHLLIHDKDFNRTPHWLFCFHHWHDELCVEQSVTNIDPLSAHIAAGQTLHAETFSYKHSGSEGWYTEIKFYLCKYLNKDFLKSGFSD